MMIYFVIFISVLAAIGGVVQGESCAGIPGMSCCPNMIPGDATGGEETNIGSYTVRECIEKCYEMPTTVAVTVAKGVHGLDRGDCFCESGVTGQNQNSGYQTCFLPPRGGKGGHNCGTAYQHGKYGGRSFVLHNSASIVHSGGNNMLSSMKIDAGKTLRVWEKRNYNGQYKDFTGEVPFVGKDWNDKISSWSCSGSEPKSLRIQLCKWAFSEAGSSTPVYVSMKNTATGEECTTKNLYKSYGHPLGHDEAYGKSFLGGCTHMEFVDDMQLEVKIGKWCTKKWWNLVCLKEYDNVCLHRVSVTFEDDSSKSWGGEAWTKDGAGTGWLDAVSG